MPDGGIDKLPPQNIEAEQAVLGAVLLDNRALMKALELIIPEDFYRESHRKIFNAMLELFDKNEAIDLVTLTEHLAREGNLDAVGGQSYLAELASMVPTAANIWFHSKILREKALLRFLLRSTTDIAGKVYEDSSEADVLLDFAEKSIFEISDKRVKAGFVRLKEVVKDSFRMIEDLYDKKEAITGVPSGFRDLDKLTTGFQKGDLIIVGGRPSMGKTAFSLNIATKVGVELGEPVAIFSLEMSDHQLALRMLCSEAMVDSNEIRKGFIPKDNWHKLTSAAGRLSEAPIYVDDTAGVGAIELRAKARRLKMEQGGLSLIIVDYLQLMSGRGPFERREQEISDISRSLKALAKELDVPVVALSQLNRGVELRTDKMPTLADLRESGAIEQDADVIVFLYRDEIYKQLDDKIKGKAIIKVAKQRNGPTGLVNLTFLDYCSKFTNSSDREEMEEVDVS